MNTRHIRNPLRLALLCGAVLAIAGCLTDDDGKESKGPAISVSPSDQIVSKGAMATFTVTASGSGPLEYEWLRNGEDFGTRPSAASLSFTVNDSDDNAEIRVRVKDENGSTLSDPAYVRIRAESEDVLLGAQGSILPSALDVDTWTTYTAANADNNSNFIDLVFAYSSATGNDSLALYSPHVAKNGAGGSAGFDFMQSWPTVNTIELRRVEVDEWDNVATAAAIRNLFDNGSAGPVPGRIFVRAGTTVVVRSNEDLYVLLRVVSVTAQSENGAGSIIAKAKW